MALPKVNWESIEGVLTDIRDAVPIVRSSVEQIKIAAGKNDAPMPTTLGASELTKEGAATAINSFLVIGGIGVLVILLAGVRFKR